MIPKKIHYIWLGGKSKSKFSESCLLTWKDKNPEFEIIEWNEKNLDLEAIALKNKFFSECMKRKLYAFMADYLRIKILYEHGGIYIDTDVQAIKPIDELALKNDELLGYEAYNNLGTGVIGACKNNYFIKQVLDFYDNEIMDSKAYVIPEVMTIVLERIKKQGKRINVFPMEYFSPYNYTETFQDKCITPNTYTIHWFDGTWVENKQVCVFLQTKHIKNPVKKKLVQGKKILGYYYRKGLKKNAK